MLTPAPMAVARPAKNAYCGRCVASATAKIGARVESEPSIRPVIAGWTRWRRNDVAEFGLEPLVIAAADINARSPGRAPADSRVRRALRFDASRRDRRTSRPAHARGRGAVAV